MIPEWEMMGEWNHHHHHQQQQQQKKKKNPAHSLNRALYCSCSSPSSTRRRNGHCCCCCLELMMLVVRCYPLPIPQSGRLSGAFGGNMEETAQGTMHPSLLFASYALCLYLYEAFLIGSFFFFFVYFFFLSMHLPDVIFQLGSMPATTQQPSKGHTRRESVGIHGNYPDWFRYW
jgi:hypothetical protein